MEKERMIYKSIQVITFIIVMLGISVYADYTNTFKKSTPLIAFLIASSTRIPIYFLYKLYKHIEK